jgi:hypothetical protein
VGNRNTYLPEVGAVIVSSDKWHSVTTDSSKSDWTFYL